MADPALRRFRRSLWHLHDFSLHPSVEALLVQTGWPTLGLTLHSPVHEAHMPIVPESWYACASLSIRAESFALPCGPVPPDIAAVHAARALIAPWPMRRTQRYHGPQSTWTQRCHSPEMTQRYHGFLDALHGFLDVITFSRRASSCGVSLFSSTS